MNGPGKVRIGALIHSMAYGGVETTILNWASQLDPKRFETYFFCFANPGGTETPFVEAAQRYGFEVRKIPWSRRKPLIRAARTMAGHVRELHLDLLHCHNPYGNILGAATRLFVRVPAMTTLYLWGEFSFRQKVLEQIDRLILPSFDIVSAHCHQTVKDTLARGIPANKVRLLLSGFAASPAVIRPEERSRLRAELGAGPDHLVLVNIARFYREKAHDVLLQGFALIRQRHPEAQLWLAGVGPLEQEIRLLTESLGLGNAVRFLGFQEDLPRLLSLTDVQVHPSRIEGVPLAICSGMAAGLPIVATRIGGIPEVLTDGENALLVEAGDVAGFADAVCRLLEDAALRARLGGQALRFIEEEYSLKAASARVGETYLEILKR